MAFSLYGFLKGISLQDTADRTKQFILQISPSATTGTSTTIVASQTADRTITLPDASGSLSTASATETLTNKTFGDPITFVEAATPSNPPASSNKLYFKNDGHVYSLDSSGVERQIDQAAAANPMTTKGDMIVGGNSGAQTRLPGGTTGQLLTYDTSAPQNIKWSTLSIANNYTVSSAITATTTSTSFSQPTNGSVNITTTGRSVMVALIPNTTGMNSTLAVLASAAIDFIAGSFEILRDGTPIGVIQVAADFPTASSQNALNSSPSSVMVIDPAPTSASHTYSLQYKANGSNMTIGITNCLLIAKEF